MISEPMTLLTDFILAAFCMKFYWEMKEYSGDHIQYWRYGFIFVAFSAFTGGIYHGFSGNLITAVVNILWLVTLQAVIIANLFFMVGLTKWSFVSSSIFYQSTLYFAIIKSIAIQTFILANPMFLIITLDYMITFILILTIRGIIWDYFDRENQDFLDLVKGFGIALLVAFVWFRQISLTDQFNYRDMAHLLQVGVMFFVQRSLSYQEPDRFVHRFLKR